MLQNSRNILWKLHLTLHQCDGEQMMTEYMNVLAASLVSL